MAWTFYFCENLTSLDVSNFDTSNVTNMRMMFLNCNLNTLDVRNWNTSNVTDMTKMFFNCNKLTLDFKTLNLDVSNVTNHDKFNYNAPGVTEPTWVN